MRQIYHPNSRLLVIDPCLPYGKFRGKDRIFNLYSKIRYNFWFFCLIFKIFDLLVGNIPKNSDIGAVMKQLKLSVKKRVETGRQYVRKLRAAGCIPAVIYGKSGTQSLSLSEKDFRLLLHEKGQSASLVSIDIAGEELILSTIADMQRDPMTDRFLHVDFHEVSKTEKMTTTVPVEFIGEAIGVRDFGGVLDISKHDLTIKCLPADLPGSIKVDVSELQVGDIIHVQDLKAIKGVEFADAADIVVVSCKNVDIEEEQPAEEEAAPAAEQAETAKAEGAADSEAPAAEGDKPADK